MPTVVLLDTNIWVSSFLNPAGSPAQVVRAWQDGRYQVVISLPLLNELADVLTRPRLTRRYPIESADVNQFLQSLSQHAILVSPTGSLQECRDPDDDLILETAILGHAQYAVTRDDDIKRDPDLIAHLQAHGVSILSVRQFLDKLSANEI